MSDAPREDTDTKKPSRWVARVAQVLVGLVLFWLVGINLALNTPLAPWAINRNPEKWSVTWQRAWSPYPLRVSLTGFEFQQRSEKRGVFITADKVKADVKIAPFFDKTFRAEGIRASGLSAVIDPDRGSGIPKPKGDRPPGFKIQLIGIDVEDLDEFRFDAFSLVGGRGSASGDFEMQIRGDMSVRNAQVDWLDALGKARKGGSGETVDVEVRCDISPFNPKKEKGLAMLSHLSGVVDVEGEVDSIRPLKYFFGGAKWIEDLNGEGAVDVRLAIEQGKLQEESKIAVLADDLLLDFMGFRATGSGRVDGTIENRETERGANITVLFDEFTYGRQSIEEPMANGAGLKLQAIIQDLDSPQLAEEITVSLDLPTSEVPDVSFLGRTVPESLELDLTGGAATMQVHLEARGGRQKAEGTFALQGTDLSGSFKDFDFEIDLDLSTKLSGRDWDDFEVRLKGTEIRFSDGVFEHPEISMADGWWMQIEIPVGRANVSEPLEIQADVDISMRDTRVLVAMFAELKAWIKHFDGLLTVEDIVGHARADLADQHLSLRDLSLTGKKLEALGELELERGQANAVFWLKYRFLGLGLERIGTEVDWKMFHARKWYDKQIADSWESKRGEPLVPEAEDAEAEE